MASARTAIRPTATMPTASSLTDVNASAVASRAKGDLRSGHSDLPWLCESGEANSGTGSGERHVHRSCEPRALARSPPRRRRARRGGARPLPSALPDPMEGADVAAVSI